MARRALVIGASGGIGAALCTEYRGRGFDVTGLSRSEDGLDVREQASVDEVLGRLEGPFDTILMATGILAASGRRPEKSLPDIEAEAMLDAMRVNALGPALVLRHVPRLLPAHGQRAEVGVLTARVGSIADNRLGGWYAYRASKAAANQIVHTAAIEIARKRPQAVVVALHPGTVDTPFTRDYAGHAKVSPAEAARNLADTLAHLTPEQSGGFFDYSGSEIGW